MHSLPPFSFCALLRCGRSLACRHPNSLPTGSGHVRYCRRRRAVRAGVTGMSTAIADQAPPTGAGSRVMTYSPATSWDPQVQQYLEACHGVEGLERISEALTRPPLATCIRANTLRTTAQELLDQLPGALSPEDRELLAAGRAQPFIHPHLPQAIIVPGTGPHAIDYSRTGGKEVVVGRLAGEAIMRGAHLFVPGLLAVSAGISRGDLVAVSVGVEVAGTTKWGMTKGTVLGIDPEKDAQLPDRSRLYIGIGRAELSRVEMFRNTTGLAVTMLERVFRTPGCGDIMRGQLMLQNLPSLLAAHVVAPTPGSRVLDMCAAPGGKTTAMAQLMQNRGEVIAFDRSHAKAREIRELAEELGITCVKAYKMDASKAVLKKAQQPGQKRRKKAAALEQQQQQQPSAAASVGEAGTPACTPADGCRSAANGAAVAAADAAGGAGTGAGGGGGDGSGGSSEGEGGRHAAAEAEAAAAAAAAARERSLANGEFSEKLRRRLERIAAARVKRGQDPGVFAQLPEGKEATVEGFEPESFDFVLLDAPCTALGLRPRLVHRQTLAELQGTAKYQRKLLDTAVQLVKPGGTLVFSTCTINPGENEGNVRYVLDTYPFMQLAQQQPRLGLPGLTGEVALPPSCGGGTLRLLSEQEAALVQRFDPSSPLDTTGFFIAKFVKVESCLPKAEGGQGDAQ